LIVAGLIAGKPLSGEGMDTKRFSLQERFLSSIGSLLEQLIEGCSG
jgi:hypothetical protein